MGAITNTQMENSNDIHQFQWLINEGLLRDEGILYGIAGADIGEKTDAIRDYYRIKTAAARTKQEYLDKKIEDINHHHSAKTTTPFHLVLLILQVLLYMAICYFNYWLERYWLYPVFHSTFICLGLYLFGLFSVFIGRSIMYNTAQTLTDEPSPVDRREKWKIYVEEFGVPLVVSSFISILPANTYPVAFTVVAALFFFMLFLLGGKGLINTFVRVRIELTEHWKTHQLRKLQSDRESTAAALKELDGEEAYKINVFTSEYNLALSNRQLA